MQNKDELISAIAKLEAQRAILGDNVVELALAALRQQLAELQPKPSESFPAFPLEGERKLVTVMFADISGFTALSEKLDPEKVRSLMNACFECLVPIIEKYEGTVDKFIGDEIMALFGAPVTHENDVERALRAALEMIAALNEFNHRQNTQLGLHFGINTGMVVAGGIGSEGRQQYSVMGDTVNLAARLEDASERGEIFAGPQTYRLAAPLFEFEAIPPLKLKGKTEPIPVYRLLRAKPVPGSIRGIEGLRSPLVGRERELDTLQATLQALQAGQSGLVALVGEAGMGKSRLVTEARQTIASSVVWVEGRALSYTQGMSYWMVRSVLSSLLGITENTLPEEATEICYQKLVGLFTEQDEIEEIYPYLSRLLELPLDGSREERVRYLPPEALKSQMFKAFGNFVQALARVQPLVMFWEDLHWIDFSSLNLLEAFLPIIERCPVLVLMAFRPDESRTVEFHRHLLSKYPETYKVIELIPLTRNNSTKLIENLLRIENLPRATHQLILDKAEGNPFFLEELLRSLLDAGVIVFRQGQARATQDVSGIVIPDTLQEVIAARIDRLAPNHKRTLQTAAVIGRIFQERLLSYLYQQISQLEPALHDLEERELIRSLKEQEYIFKHAVTQEVAYGSLLIARRIELHRVAGEAIEALFPDRLDELADTLAYHYDKAEVIDKAVHYLIKAADRARVIYANSEAIGFYRAAIERLNQSSPSLSTNAKNEQGKLITELCESLADILTFTARHEEARVAYQAAIDHTLASDYIRQSRVQRKYASTWQVQGRHEEALQVLDLAEASLGEKPANKDKEDELWWQEWLQIQLERTLVHYYANQLEDITRLMNETQPLLELKGSPVQRGLFYQRLALLAFRRDRAIISEETLGYARASLTAIQEAANLSELPYAHFLLGFTYLWHHDLAEAETQMQEALKLAERIGDMTVRTRALAYLTLIYRKLGLLDQLREYIERGMAVALDCQMPEYIASGKANRAWLAWKEGRLDEAEFEGREAVELWQKGQIVFGSEWQARWPLLAVAIAKGQLAEAIAEAKFMLGPAQQLFPDKLATALQEAIQTWEGGKIEEAQAYFSLAIELAQKWTYL